MCKVSFLIPAYNAEKSIGRCLDSILTSGLSPNDYEIIVWNDGSIDQTEDIVQSYTEKYSNISLLLNKIKELQRLENHCFDLQKGHIYGNVTLMITLNRREEPLSAETLPLTNPDERSKHTFAIIDKMFINKQCLCEALERLGNKATSGRTKKQSNLFEKNKLLCNGFANVCGALISHC